MCLHVGVRVCCTRARYRLAGRIDGPGGTRQLQETAADRRTDGRMDEKKQGDKSEKESTEGRKSRGLKVQGMERREESRR